MMGSGRQKLRASRPQTRSKTGAAPRTLEYLKNRLSIISNTQHNAQPLDGTISVADTPLSAQQQARKKTLKQILVATTARQEKARRNRRPALAIGQRVLISQGPQCGEQADVLDADYIDNQALLQFAHEPLPYWLPFEDIGEVVRDIG